MKKTVLCIILALTLAALTGCSSLNIYLGQDLSLYASGSTEISEPVDSLDIDWPYGAVTITHFGDVLTVEETGTRDIPEELALCYLLDGTTLRIRYCGAVPFPYTTLTKSLYVTLPEDCVLKSLDVSSASAFISAFTSTDSDTNIDISASSGNMDLVFDNVGKLDISTSSGAINMTAENVAEMDVSTSSGNAYLYIVSAGELDASTSSGVVELNAGSLDTADISTSSGNVAVTLEKAPKSLEISTSSGKQHLTLPEDAGFTAEVSTSSGDFTCEFPVVMKSDETFVSGDGSAQLELSASSGDITLDY